MRGYRLPKSSRKLDVVIVAARYTQRSNKLTYGQAYLRRGPIWGDLVLLERDEVLKRLKAKQQVVTGKPDEIPGEFTVFNSVQFNQTNGSGAIYVDQPPAKGDDLGVPLF